MRLRLGLRQQGTPLVNPSGLILSLGGHVPQVEPCGYSRSAPSRPTTEVGCMPFGPVTVLVVYPSGRVNLGWRVPFVGR
jgi:hypothetical protein